MNGFVEDSDAEFVKALSTKYKRLILGNQPSISRVLISSRNLQEGAILCKEYVDETSCLVMREEEDRHICVMDIPPSFFNYFIGKNEVMKIKHERQFCIKIVVYDNKKFTIIVTGEGRDNFKKYILDRIYTD